MATFTLVAGVFPEGTSIGMYPASVFAGEHPPAAGRPPSPPAAETQVMNGGSATFRALSDGTTYFAGAQVGGIWRYVTAEIPALVIDTSARVLREAPLNITWPEYGADATAAGTANSTAIQRAINAVRGSAGSTPRGGELLIPRGSFPHNGLDFSDTRNMTVIGEGGTAGGQGDRTASRLLFTGTGSGRALDCRSAGGLTFRDLGIQYSSSSFTGTLIDFAHSASGVDASTCLIDSCLLYPEGSSFSTAAVLVSYENAIIQTIRNCTLGGAKKAIKGRTSDGSAYSNVVNIEDCSFNNCVDGFIYNVGQSWKVDGNTFELLNTLGVASTPRCYDSDYNVGVTGGGHLTWTNNWHGDLGLQTLDFIRLRTNDSLNYFNCQGNFFSGGAGAPSISLLGEVDGGIITANDFSQSGSTSAIDLGVVSGGVGIKRALSIIANHFSGSVTNEWIEHRKDHYRLVILGNTDPNTVSRDHLALAGHLLLGTLSSEGGNPTVTLEAGAGSTATATVTGTDMAGLIEVAAAGTGRAPGALCDLVFSHDVALDLPGSPNSQIVKMLVSPLNAAAAAAGIYHDYDYGLGSDVAYRTAKVRFNAVGTPAATTHRFGYLAYV